MQVMFRGYNVLSDYLLMRISLTDDGIVHDIEVEFQKKLTLKQSLT